MNASDLHTLTGVYALDALEADEAALFEEHLDRCPECRREVQDLQEAAGALALEALSAPPEHVRERIFAAIERPAAVARDGASRSPAAVPFAPAIDERVPDRDPATVASLRPRPGRRRPAVVLIAAAAAVVVVMVGFVVARAVPGPGGGLADAVRDEVAATAAVVRGPDTRTIPLDGPDGATGRVLWSEREARGILAVESLPAPGPGQAYELWYIDDSPRPGPVFDAGVRAVRIAGQGPRPPATFAVTIEPAGGVDTPTGPVVLSGGAGR